LRIDAELRLMATMELAHDQYDTGVRAKPATGGVREDTSVNTEIASLKEYDNSLLIDAALKNQLERAFDADLSSVRIHTGAYADALTKQHGADAVTIGSDIYFARGKYSPDTEGGISLLAHEIQHTVQYLNNNRLVYMEDIDTAEREASKVESNMSGIRLHDINEPILDESSIPAIPSGSIQALKKPGGFNLIDQIKDFTERRSKPVYEIILKDGSRVELTKKEMEDLFLEFEKKIHTWLNEIKTDHTEEEYNKKFARFMEIIK
jgi:hypothetical protein